MKADLADAGTATDALQAFAFSQPPITQQTVINDGKWRGRFGLRSAIGRVARWIRSLGPYLAIELILPGGSIITLALWTYRHRSTLQRYAVKSQNAAIRHKPILTCARLCYGQEAN